MQTPDGEWHPLTEGTWLEEGTVIRTGVAGTVDLQFPASDSEVRMAACTSLKLDKVEYRDPAKPTALEVVMSLKEGRVTGSFKSGPAPSIFELIPPRGKPAIYRPEPGQSVPIEMAWGPSFQWMPSINILPPEDIFNGGASSVALQGGQPFPPSLIIPEPATGALLALGAAALGWRLRRRGRFALLPRVRELPRRASR